jgi:hypothetical protein
VPVFFAPFATKAVPPGSVSFAYTGNVQTFTVPRGIYQISALIHGAQGGSAYYDDVSYYSQDAAPSKASTTYAGGLGAMLSVTLKVTPGQIFYVTVGGQGAGNNQGQTAGAGGYNGGAGSLQVPSFGTWASLSNGAGGGGMSDLRLGGDGLANLVAAAAGGGGAGAINWASSGATAVGGGNGGNGGHTQGYAGANSVTASTYMTANDGTPAPGGGAVLSPAAGGVPGGSYPYTHGGGIGYQAPVAGIEGYGGRGDNYGGGGGGGGYYGGAGGMFGAGGGGGCSYVEAGVTLVSSTDGERAGNGLIVISWSY